MAGQDESQNGRKPMIVGGAKERPTDEMDEITQMIEEAQHSSRAATSRRKTSTSVPPRSMSPHVAEIVAASKVDVILQKFNRDYLYGMGRFDEYAGGLLLKWGDGYSRKHIWVTVDGRQPALPDQPRAQVLEAVLHRWAARLHAGDVARCRARSTPSWPSSSSAPSRSAPTTTSSYL